MNVALKQAQVCLNIGSKIGEVLRKGGINICELDGNICPGSGAYRDSVDELLPILKSVAPSFYSQLILERNNLVIQNKCVNPFAFGAIQGLLSVFILSNKDDLLNYKIFISHAFKDKNIVTLFVDKILTLGCKIEAKDIYCTSVDGLGIKTGDDFREHIKSSLQQSDFVFLMISKSYKLSEMCLNEMGAAWALDKKVIPIIIDDIDFDEMGVIYKVKQGMKIKDDARLDELYEEITTFYEIKQDMRVWNRHKREFIVYD